MGAILRDGGGDMDAILRDGDGGGDMDAILRDGAARHSSRTLGSERDNRSIRFGNGAVEVEVKEQDATRSQEELKTIP